VRHVPLTGSKHLPLDSGFALYFLPARASQGFRSPRGYFAV
jgi:hypothetical protein